MEDQNIIDNAENKKDPEKILEELRGKGLITEEDYLKAKTRFEDLNDRLKLSAEEIYKKAYKNRRLDKCVEEILNMGYDNRDRFKRIFLISDCLKNPLGYSFKGEEYVFAMNILSKSIEQANKRNYSKEFVQGLRQCVLLTHVLHQNNKSNTKRLLDNGFSKYSLSEQIRMICIFMQDQTRLMKNMLQKPLEKNNFFTGMEIVISDRKVDYCEGTKVSLVDNYEGMLEYFDVLIRYLYVTRKNELKNDNTESHGDIHPFNIPSLEEVTYIAMQRVMYLNLESKFRYSQWELSTTTTLDNKDIALFKPKYLERYRSHIVAGVRRRYQLTTNCLEKSDMEETNVALDTLNILGEQVDIYNFEEWKVNDKLYEKARLIASPIILAYKSLAKPFYLTCMFNNIHVEDLISAYEFLFTMSKIYITGVLNIFDEKNYSHFKYLVPVIKIDYLVSEFSRLYSHPLDYAKKIILCFVYDDSVRNDDGDIFTRPLIKINKNKILFCETLIEQVNLDRSIETLLLKYDVDLSPMGLEFEKKLVEKLAIIPGIQVNTNHIVFHAYDNRDVEFDFIGTLNNYLLLFEFKSVITLYDDKQLYKNEQTIKEGIKQVLRRCEIAKHDWDKIKQLVNIELPEVPYNADKIIKVVCTNIYDFTTLKYEDVRVTDESTLLKYFTDPYVGVFSQERELKVMSVEQVWKNGKPDAIEFIEYLDRPVTVGSIPDCLKEESKIIPAFEGDFPIGFVNSILVEDPYKKMIKSKLTIDKKKKVGRNDPCPCGSGKKYKKCCVDKEIY